MQAFSAEGLLPQAGVVPRCPKMTWLRVFSFWRKSFSACFLYLIFCLLRELLSGNMKFQFQLPCSQDFLISNCITINNINVTFFLCFAFMNIARHIFLDILDIDCAKIFMSPVHLESVLA